MPNCKDTSGPNVLIVITHAQFLDNSVPDSAPTVGKKSTDVVDHCEDDSNNDGEDNCDSVCDADPISQDDSEEVE